MAAKIQNGRHNVRFSPFLENICLFWLQNCTEEHKNDWKLSGEYKIRILKQIEKFKMAAKIQNGCHNVRFSPFLANICLFWLQNYTEDHKNDWKLSGEYKTKF